MIIRSRSKYCIISSVVIKNEDDEEMYDEEEQRRSNLIWVEFRERVQEEEIDALWCQS